ncbi:peroxiredoxin [Paenibacillus thermotolerans]|uniref:peroxiredoxin n=1 Tax=Paenibacillus thermotolerans TaxID=3027807 RepID=UPI0023688D17|nr:MULTISPECIES: redoxin domain-containing protein [unclassified Paenibacillus]
MVNIGDPAPAFEADSTMGKVKLQDVLGKRPVVLIFYPMDDTPTCTKQLCAVGESKHDYEQAGAAVFGVNPADVEKHSRFAGKFGYDFPLIADTGERIRKAYGIGKILGIIGQQRTVVVIDKEGRIAAKIKGNPPTDQILSVLRV